MAGRMVDRFGLGTSTYAEVGEMAYDEFMAWCAFFNHATFHRDDAAEQAKHDQMMAALAAAARG